MNFYINKNEMSKDILIEFMNQYADSFQHLGLNKWNQVIRLNLELLQIVIEEWKDDSELEFSKI